METFDRPKVCEWELVAFFQKLMCYEYKLVKNHYIDATLYLLPHVTYWWFLKNDSEITTIHKEQNHTQPSYHSLDVQMMFNSIVVYIDKMLITYQAAELQIMVILLMSNC